MKPEPSIRAAVRSDVELINPTTAERWLAENNHVNRAIRPRVVTRYAAEMASGEFPNTGESIIFDWDSQLVSGQHRLLAIVESGVTLSMVIVRGVDPAVRDVVDTGVKRTLADSLRLHGEVDSNNVAAAIGYFWRYTQGKMRWPNIRPSNIAALALLEEHPGLREATKVGSRLRRRLGGSVGLYGALFYVFDYIDHDTAEEFVEQLTTGALLCPGDPAFAFRRFMANVTPARKPSAIYIAALLVKAWNMTRAGKQVQTLVWRPASGEPFPVAK
jgi:hypothetical protein